MAVDERWNHNIHYHRVVLGAVPDGARTALDVGAGDGLLTRELRTRVPHVTAIDVDRDVVTRARTQVPGATWVVGDVLDHPLEPGAYDVVASVATLHHLPDLAAGLNRLAELTAPGGVLAVVGLARSTRLGDVSYEVAGAVQHWLLTRRRPFWEHSAPTVWPPPHTYAEVRRTATAVLPGVRWRRLAMWRYSLLWSRPPEE